MTREETRIFKLLDGYARRSYECFVAEFDLDKTESRYNVCFRPLGSDVNSSNRFACKFVTIDRTDVDGIRAGEMLPDAVADLMNRVLPALKGLK